MDKKVFGAYDIRGIYPEKVNDDLAYTIGRILPGLIKGRKFAVGRDVRLSSASLQMALIKGLRESGCEVYDIGLCGTEMIYFAVPHLDLDGGIMITASHNPKDYNGMKFVGRGSVPLNKEVFKELERQVVNKELPSEMKGGLVYHIDLMKDYVEKILSCIDVSLLKDYKVVVNAGNGCAGPVLEFMEKFLPFHMTKRPSSEDDGFHGLKPFGLKVRVSAKAE